MLAQKHSLVSCRKSFHNMIEIKRDFSLKNEHTFHVEVKASFFVEIHSREELVELISDPVYKNNPSIIIGRGSNILFANDYPGLVIKMSILGKKIVSETDDAVVLDIAAGEEWHSFVMYAVENNLGGIENLALIPGTVGAAPIQNIGAYGQNFEEVFISLEAVDLKTCAVVTLTKEECGLNYRTSIFKEALRGKYIVVSVRIKLQKNPRLELSYTSRYESLQGELATFAQEPYSTKDVAQAVINIRSKKLPNPDIAGNAGSFFKNPLVDKRKIIELQKTVPNLPFYPANAWSGTSKNILDMPDDMMYKIPAAWLLEDMGWKGKRDGNCGTWPTQPMSIVNYGNATPHELMRFAESVQKAVQDRYGITLQAEVEIIGE